MAKVKRNLIIFICVTIASGWLGVLLDSVLTEQPEGDTLGMGLWLVAPFLTAVLLRVISRDGKGMGLKPYIKKNWKGYVAATLVYPAVTIITVGLAFAFGLVAIPSGKTLPFTLIVSSLIYAFIKNIFEEFAWRGYLTPKLIELKCGDAFIYFATGLVWALWHTAYYMVFLPESYFTSMTRVQFTLLATLIMLCWNIMFVELYRLTKSVWPGVLMHAVEDVIPTLLVTGGYLVFRGVGDTLFNPMNGIIATILFVGFGLLLRGIRIKRERNI